MLRAALRRWHGAESRYKRGLYLALRRTLWTILWTSTAGFAPEVAKANQTRTAKTFEMIAHCQSGEFSRYDLQLEGMRSEWIAIPSKGVLAERFTALETEGMDVGNQEAIGRSASEFEGIELYQTRTMLLIEENGDAVAFVGEEGFGSEIWCTFTTTFPITFSELETSFGAFATDRKIMSENDVLLTGVGRRLSMTMMPDQETRPLTGAQMQIHVTAEQRE